MMWQSVDNKGFSERYVTAPVSPLGQYTVVPSKFATAVALPTTMPVDPARRYRDAGMGVDPRKPLPPEQNLPEGISGESGTADARDLPLCLRDG